MACVFAARIALRRSLRSSCLAARRAYSNGGDGLPLTFATPTQAFYDNANVKQVDVCCTSGSFGILPEHVPSIAVLKPGLLTVYEQDKMAKYFASSGSVTINADSSVQILAEEAYSLDQIDPNAARQGLEKCQQQVTSGGTEMERTEAAVGVELYEALIKALEQH